MNELLYNKRRIYLTMNNKKTLTSNQTSSRNLKNIINQTRVPLSKYINKKVGPTDKNLPYLDKLKQMFNVNHHTIYNNKPMARYSDNYMRTQQNTIISDTFMYDETPKRAHQRVESSFTPTQAKYSNNRLKISQKKCTDQDLINQIKNDLIKKRVISTHTYATTVMTKNKTKLEVFNYNNFMPIPNRNQDQSNMQICTKWGKMQLGQVLGTGANAVVRQGICHNTKFAVKVYQKYKLLQPKKKKRVYAQIQLLKHISQHPNIITMYQSFEDKRQIHVIFQHLSQSITLHQYFRNHMLFLQEKIIQKIFGKIARGVHHLHQYGIAHRDIKPDNILICFNQDGQTIVKIIDFGFATMASKADLHCGTPNFMAPQLLDKSNKYCPLSVDIWALGVTLFYLCQGRYPFKGFDEKDLYKNIRKCQFQFKKITSPSIIKIIEQTLLPNPNQRLTIEELLKNQWVLHA